MAENNKEANVITIYKKNASDEKFKQIQQFQKGSWIYVENPTKGEIKKLIKDFSLNPDQLRDAQDPYEVPRIEVEDEFAYIFTRVPYAENGKVQTKPFLIIMANDFILTISQNPFPFFENLTNGKADFATSQRTKAVLKIFFQIDSFYRTHLTDISKKVRSLGVNVERITNYDIVQFVNYESILNDFMAALVPTNALVKSLHSDKYLNLFEKEKELTQDLLLENEELVGLCRANLTNIVNIRQAYSSIMTNNLNRVIKLFTSLTVILTIPTMIASIYGMNIHLPLADSSHAFAIIIITILTIVILLLGIFIKNDWL
ncbi:magnesium transporter CorA family protein [Candidatus Curtissbacteria bacterium]|nr:magnesium transporter CorA family protein [Candidatus Curtissbacteria bacterium]